MKEYLFKAKRVDNGEDVEGYYWQNEVGNHFIRVTTLNGEYVLRDYEVDPETVRQFTGLCDKNGKGIFEGDICSCFCNTQIFVVKYCQDRCGYFFDNCVLGGGCEPCSECLGNLRSTIEVIGNIYDNSELLEVKE